MMPLFASTTVHTVAGTGPSDGILACFPKRMLRVQLTSGIRILCGRCQSCRSEDAGECDEGSSTEDQDQANSFDLFHLKLEDLPYWQCQ